MSHHVLATLEASPWLWHWVQHTSGLDWLYRKVSWTWGGAGQGGQASEAYAMFSGPVPCLALLALIGGFWHNHNCHEPRCLRLSWHPDADGHPVCKIHHPDHPAQGWFRKHPRRARDR